jgi:endo-1,4-beta-D-glucanase Y
LKLTRTVLITLGSSIIGIVIVAIGVRAYMDSYQRTIPLVYSNKAMLYELWNAYKLTNLEPGSDRTIDHSQPGNSTTSQGESYTMLRAVWMDDEATYDKSLAFSLAYLQRSDHLFAGKYAQLANGKYGVNAANGDATSNSGSDTAIALSLLMAYSRWDQAKYFTFAKPIITAIWNEEVVNVAGQPVMVADNLQRTSSPNVIVNPSYFNLAAYKLFAKVDPAHNWTALADNSYTVLRTLSTSSLGLNGSDGLPPDWIAMNRTTGDVLPASTAALDTNYGADASQIPFNLALDYEWYDDARDKQLLNTYTFLGRAWRTSHVLASAYTHSGAVLDNTPSPAMYGASIGYFIVADPADVTSVYQRELQVLYSPDKQSWRTVMSYYNDNWAWFGLALEQHALPNLTTRT